MGQDTHRQKAAQKRKARELKKREARKRLTSPQQQQNAAQARVQASKAVQPWAAALDEMCRELAVVWDPDRKWGLVLTIMGAHNAGLTGDDLMERAWRSKVDDLVLDSTDPNDPRLDHRLAAEDRVELEDLCQTLGDYGDERLERWEAALERARDAD